jgi:hypothetical protein
MDLLTQIDSIQEVAINKAIQILVNMKCEFAVITPTGKKFGNLEVSEQNKRNLKYPMGTLKNYYHPYLKDLEVGAATFIPVGEFSADQLQSSLSAWCSTNWGKGTYATRTTERQSGLGVEVVRFL